MKFTLKIKPKIFQDWWHRLMYLWIKYYKLLFLLAFILVIAAGAFQWYYQVKKYSWTAEEKKAFLDRTVKETTLQEEKLRKTLTNLSDLREAHQRTLPITRDLFLGKKEMKKE